MCSSLQPPHLIVFSHDCAAIFFECVRGVRAFMVRGFDPRFDTERLGTPEVDLGRSRHIHNSLQGRAGESLSAGTRPRSEHDLHSGLMPIQTHTCGGGDSMLVKCYFNKPFIQTRR